MTSCLLLIDDSISSVDVFVGGLNSNTKHVLYNVADSFEVLTQKIQELGVETFDNIGFVFDDSGPLKMFVSYNSFITFDQSGMTANNTTNFIKNLVQTYSVKTVDFLACNLLSYTEWKNYFTFLISENTGLFVRASEDLTGNLSVGGDWVLETTNEDIKQLYFSEDIQYWNYLLGSGSNTSAVIGVDGIPLLWGQNSNSVIKSITTGIYNPTVDRYNNIFPNVFVSSISVGANHTVALINGNVWACGLNSSNQLGDGTTTSRTIFVQSTDASGAITDATAIAAGDNHTVIIRRGGEVWACGANTNGQLGIGSTSNSSRFVRSQDSTLANIGNATAIAAGASHTLIIRNDSSTNQQQLWACGSATNGRLGDGQVTTQRTRFVQSRDSSGFITDVVAIAAGSAHSLIIRSGGTVWACGNQLNGRLGNGLATTGSISSFTAASWSDGATINVINDAVAVAAGSAHSLIMRAGGTVWACGLNTNGQLGLGTSGTGQDKSYFFQSSDSSGFITDATSIATSSSSNYNLILRGGGQLWGCGTGTSGVLGNNSTSLQSLYIRGTDSSGNVTNATSIATGTSHSSIIRAGGQIWSSGSASDGRTGLAYNGTGFTIPIKRSDISNVVSISTGTGHVVVLKSDGTVWSCGNNSTGALGDGSTITKTSFVQALDLSSNPVTNVIAIAAGGNHTVLLRNNGEVLTSGYNFNGQLSIANNNTTDRSLFGPTQDSNGTTVTNGIAIAASTSNTAVIRGTFGQAGSVWICGGNTFGQCSDGSTVDKTRFIQCVEGIAGNAPINNATAVSLGGGHSVIIRGTFGQAGSVWSCGNNAGGRTGLGVSTGNQLRFAQSLYGASSPIGNAVRAISAGANHTTFLQGNIVYSAGQGGQGALGNNSTADGIYFTTAQDTTGSPITNAVAITSGTNYTAILRSNNTLWSTGTNTNGQLGNTTSTQANRYTQIDISSTIITETPIYNPTGSGFTALNTNNAFAWFPNMMNNNTISATDVTSTSTTFNSLSLTTKKVVDLSPSNTVFSKYINFDITGINSASDNVYFKSDADASPVQIYTTDASGYGAYYQVKNSSTITVYTKHFSEIAVGSSAPSGPTVPGVPTNVSATVGNGQVELSWTAPTSDGGAAITSYKIYDGALLYTTSSTTNKTITGLTNGVIYNFRISAVNSAGEGTISSGVSVTPRTVPDAPTGVSTTAGNAQITVSWTAPSSNGGATITSYNIYNGAALLGSSASSPATITGLTNGTTYSITVKAVNVAGEGAASSPASSVTPVTTPSAPTGLVATAGNGQLSISFTAGSDGGSAITKYQYSYDASGTYVDASGSPIVITSLTNGTSYTVLVRAVNTVGNGATASVSGTPVTTPSSPTAVYTSEVDNGAVTLYWTAPADNGGAAITGYNVYNRADSVVAAGVSGESYEITGLTGGYTYGYYVKAVSSVGAGAASATVSFFLPGEQEGFIFDASTNVLGTYQGIAPQSLVLPETTTKIASDAFVFQESLQNITVPLNIEYIATNAFRDSSDVTLTFYGDAPTLEEGAIPASITLNYIEGAAGWPIAGISNEQVVIHPVSDATLSYILSDTATNTATAKADFISAISVKTSVPISQVSLPPTDLFNFYTHIDNTLYNEASGNDLVVLPRSGPTLNEAKLDMTQISGMSNIYIPLDSSNPSDYMNVTINGTLYRFSHGSNNSLVVLDVSANTTQTVSLGGSYVVGGETIDYFAKGSATGSKTLSGTPFSPTIINASFDASGNFTFTPQSTGQTITGYRVYAMNNSIRTILIDRTNDNSITINKNVISDPTFTSFSLVAYNTLGASFTLSPSVPLNISPPVIQTITSSIVNNKITLTITYLTSLYTGFNNITLEVWNTGNTTRLYNENISVSSTSSSKTVTLSSIVYDSTLTYRFNVRLIRNNNTYGYIKTTVYQSSGPVIDEANPTILESWRGAAPNNRIIIPDGITEISSFALSSVSGTNITVRVPRSVTKLNTSSLRNSNIKNIEMLGNGITGMINYSNPNGMVITSVIQPGARIKYINGASNIPTNTFNSQGTFNIPSIQFNPIQDASGELITTLDASGTALTKRSTLKSQLEIATEVPLSSVAIQGAAINNVVTSYASGFDSSKLSNKKVHFLPRSGPSKNAAKLDISSVAQSDVLYIPGTNGDTLTVSIDGSDNTFTILSNGVSMDGTTYALGSALTLGGKTFVVAFKGSAGLIQANAPDTPTNLSATVGVGQIQFQWKAPTNNGGSDITKYVLKNTGDNSTQDITSSEWSFNSGTGVYSYTKTGLDNGTSYTFEIAAVNVVGSSSYSSFGAKTTPSAPGAPTITSVTAGNGLITVGFTAPASNGGSAITDYKYSLNGGSYISAGTTSSPITITSGITNGNSYTVTLNAVNAVGDGTASSTSDPVVPSTTPGQPQVQSVTVGNESLTFKWLAPLDNGGDSITKYILKDTSDNSLTNLTGLTPDASGMYTYVKTGLTNGVSYTYAIAAYNVRGAGEYTAFSSATPATVPDAPGNLVVVTVGDREIYIDWDAPTSDGGSAITEYKYSTDGGVTYSETNSTNTDKTLTGLTNGQEYTIDIVATNAQGDSSPAQVVATPLPSAPQEPQGFSASGGVRKVVLSWTTPSLNTSDANCFIKNYIIYDASDAEIATLGPYSQGDTLPTSYEITDLANSTQYSFTMATKNNYNQLSGDAGSASATTFSLPGAPTNLVVTPGNNQLSLTWDAPTSNGGSPITSYEYSLNGGTSFISTGSTSTSKVLTIVNGISNGVTFNIKVRAVTLVGAGAATATVQGTAATVPGQPTSLQTPISGDTELTFKWKAPSSNGGSAITQYVLRRTGASDTLIDVSGLTVDASGVYTYIKTGLTNGVSYTFSIGAKNIMGTSSFASFAAATPESIFVTPQNAPVIDSITAGNGTLTVYFTQSINSYTESITGYKYSTTGATGTYTLRNGTSNPIVISGLTNGQQYTVAIKAITANSESDPSNEVQGTPTSGYVPCIVEGQRVLTHRGYVKVEELGESDYIITSDGRPVAANVYKFTIPCTTDKTAPITIKANAFAPRSPPNDVRLSPLHAIQRTKGVWDIPIKAMKRYENVVQDEPGDSVTYYHIETPNYLKDNLVVEGATVESFGVSYCKKHGLKATDVYKWSTVLQGYTRTNPTISKSK